jgi:H+-translocating NAD(P) transhydrogenase
MGGQFLKVNFEEDGSGAGGYAKEMSKEYKAAEREMLRAAACDADIIISTALIPGRPAPLLIPKEAVAGMKAGSVTVDLAAETGGNIETTVRDKLIVTENGVKCIGYTDMNSRLSSTSSSLYANNVFKFLLSIGPQTTKNKVYSGDHIHTNTHQCFSIKREREKRKVKHIQTLFFIIFIFVLLLNA